MRERIVRENFAKLSTEDGSCKRMRHARCNGDGSWLTRAEDLLEAYNLDTLNHFREGRSGRNSVHSVSGRDRMRFARLSLAALRPPAFAWTLERVHSGLCETSAQTPRLHVVQWQACKEQRLCRLCSLGAAMPTEGFAALPALQLGDRNERLTWHEVPSRDCKAVWFKSALEQPR